MHGCTPLTFLADKPVDGSRITDFLAFAVGPAAGGLAYYAAAALSLALTKGVDGIATVWVPSGLLFAVMLLVPRAMVARYVTAAAVASMVANLAAGTPLAWAIAFTVANMSESLIGRRLLRKRGLRISFVDPRGLRRFCVAALAAAAASATVATVATPVGSMRFLLSWFSTDLLGLLIVAPLLLSAIELRAAKRRGREPGPRPIEVAALLGMVAVVTAVVFSQSRYPILFVPMIALIVAVFRLGTVGATGGVLIVAIIGSVAVVFDRGPQSLVQGGNAGHVLFLQSYLLALFAASLPMGALLAARNRLQTELAERVRLMTQAERAAQIGHWRVDPEAQSLYWSDETFRIHGLEPGPAPIDGALSAYHPEDQERVRTIVQSAMATGEAFTFSARIIRPDGSIRHIVSRGERDFSSSEDAIGLFGLFPDVTARIESERILTQARDAAERIAQAAMTLAETDQLTGLANRRKTLAVLDRAIADAQGAAGPLSVAIFDIDHFKAINDRFGHAMGDAVLCRVSRAAEAVLRGTDIVGRFGGEEFVLILPDALPPTALAIAERVRGAIEASAGPGGDPAVTVSIGLATLDADTTADALLSRADAALYEAKHHGRNRTRLAA